MARQTSKIDGFQSYPTYQCRRDCVYYALSDGTCDYFLLTGRRRGCPCGKDCAKYQPRGKVRRSGAAFNQDFAYNLWKDGKTDQEIGTVLGVSQTAVLQWRRRKNLTPNGRRGPKKNLEWRERARKLYDAGPSTDREIGKAVGVSESAIQHWRKEEGLKRGRTFTTPAGTRKRLPSCARAAFWSRRSPQSWASGKGRSRRISTGMGFGRIRNENIGRPWMNRRRRSEYGETDMGA